MVLPSPTKLFRATVTHVDGTSYGALVNGNSEVREIIRESKERGHIVSPVKQVILDSTPEYIHYLMGKQVDTTG